MPENFELHAPSVPESVRKRIFEFVRPNAEYLRIGTPEVKAVSSEKGKVEAYALSVRKNVPDAYFDPHGNFLFSVPGILEFDGWSAKSPAARDAFRLAGFSEDVSKEGRRTWFRDTTASEDPDGRSKGREPLDPFGQEAFSRLKNLAFHQDRIDMLRSLRAKTANPKAPGFPEYSADEIGEFVKSGSVTIIDLVKLKRVGLVSERTFSEKKAEVARLLPAQLLDPRFAASVTVRSASGTVAEVRPSWHNVDRAAVDALVRDGLLDQATQKAVTESLDLLKKRAEAFGLAMADSREKLAELQGDVLAA